MGYLFIFGMWDHFVGACEIFLVAACEMLVVPECRIFVAACGILLRHVGSLAVSYEIFIIVVYGIFVAACGIVSCSMWDL